ncbi:hypothetical protein F4819DRAFT_40975 [Hypoxylon fuscum]|nr:hypothetical protein F4819DRAFT_40975 [Hypoxylon fuscum]
MSHQVSFQFCLRTQNLPNFNLHLNTVKLATMFARLSTIVLALALVAPILAAPAPRPANFETDPMLQVGEKAASSYAESDKRANFETDPMLQVGEKAASSYAESDKQSIY